MVDLTVYLYKNLNLDLPLPRMTDMNQKEFYKDLLTQKKEFLQSLQSRKSLLGWIRFGTIIFLVIVIYLLAQLSWIYIASAIVVILAVFVRIVFVDLRNRDKINHTKLYILAIEEELLAINENYNSFYNGEAYSPAIHDYAGDMDVLGKASLYQFCNRTETEPGQRLLADWLLAPAHEEEISQRKEAVNKLSEDIPSIIEFRALSKAAKLKEETIDSVEEWLSSPDIFSGFKAWKWLRYLLPAIILTITVLTIFSVLTLGNFYVALFLFAALTHQLDKKIKDIHNKLSLIVEEMEVMQSQLKHLEALQVGGEKLTTLKSSLLSHNTTASAALEKIKKLLERLDIRYNLVLAIPFNILLLWNLQQVLDLEKWKKEEGGNFTNWVKCIAEIECINSFALLRFNYPDWVWTQIKKEHFYIKATALGHPLIPIKKRITNPIEINSEGKVQIITGSNMAGKSTYLRSIGVNVILAMAGAPVCATHFALSPVKLLSSMRVADNLEESTSTFYAELKKLKSIIEKTNSGEKVFVLLDEILRGTNSFDRHKGSVALVKQFLKKDAVAILATHDVELAAVKEEFPNRIDNYHFDVDIEGEELFFDYKLKPGICKSLNASLLMKKIGINLEENF